MPRFYGQGCGPLNNCGVYKGAGWMCECDGEGNCFEQPVGEPELWAQFGNIDDAAFAALMDASSNKFIGAITPDGSLKLQEVGMLAAAKLQPGDILLSIIPLSRDSETLSIKRDKTRVLTWQVFTPSVGIVFERDGEVIMDYMSNPAYKGE